MCAVVFDYTQGILCYWCVAHSRAGSHYAKCSSSHHPSWHIVKICLTTQAGVSKRSRRLKTRRRWWEPAVNCQHVGHDVGNETSNTRWGGLWLSLSLSLYHYLSLTLCVWPSWIVVLFLLSFSFSFSCCFSNSFLTLFLSFQFSVSFSLSFSLSCSFSFSLSLSNSLFIAWSLS